MKRIAIIGGGISGLTAAYELELARKRGAAIDWHLYEASDRLGGIIETMRYSTPEGEFILEGGPDGWVSEKPWARELAIELGLEPELIYSNDATRKTYILIDGKLQAIPDRMRMMIPEDLSALEGSPLFSESAKKAYAEEVNRADELKASAPDHDESVADFVRRHFGDEVLNTLAAPLLSGVFGGDVHKLSVRAVMPQFVAIEREHGSLIAGLQVRTQQRTQVPQPIFSSLRRGIASLIEALAAKLPVERVHMSSSVCSLLVDTDEWFLEIHTAGRRPRMSDYFDHVIFATPVDVVRKLGIVLLDEVLRSSTGRFMRLAPTEASSAILAAMAWPTEAAKQFSVPQGFGLLIPHSSNKEQLLACTFVDQKFPDRAPQGARILRAFFGGAAAESLATASDDVIAAEAHSQLEAILGPLPRPAQIHVRRLPRSLPQYEVDHLNRIAELEFQISRDPMFSLLGNGYHGVGIPDLIRDARATAREVAEGI